MANANAPFGLRPYSYRNGNPYAGAVRTYWVSPSYGSAIYLGDPVIPTGTSDANGIPGVQLATAGAGTYTVGPMQGITNNAGPLIITLQQTQSVYLPANTGGYIYVADDPTLLFCIQENSSPSALSVNAASENAAMTAGSGGSTISGQSSWQVDSNTAQTGASQLRLIQLLQEADNVPGNFQRWLVFILQHSMLNTTGI
jgi:hypothetical protein